MEVDVDSVSNEARAWRRWLHRNPELQFDLPRTAGYVAGKLRDFGCDAVVEGIAVSGVVAVIEGRDGPGRTVALRSDMDALPIEEATGLDHMSVFAGRMHACGHDGHMAMLLGAAKCLAEDRSFRGRVALVFQPAEEGGGGAKVMIDEGLIERFGIEEVYGMHNEPGLAIGSFAIRGGPFMAAADRFMVTLRGRGGHAASPHLATDPVVAATQMTVALQTIASRFVDPLDAVVVSVTHLDAGTREALNVIPSTTSVGGTIRAMRPDTRLSVERRFREIVEMTAALFACHAEVDWMPGYPVTVNDPAMTAQAVAAASRVAGTARVDTGYPPSMGAEDFSYMLEERPGAIILIGNGDSAYLHHPGYDFADDAIAHGVGYWLALVRQRLG